MARKGGKGSCVVPQQEPQGVRAGRREWGEGKEEGGLVPIARVRGPQCSCWQPNVVPCFAPVATAGGTHTCPLAGPVATAGPGKGKVEIRECRVPPPALWLSPTACPTLSAPSGLKRTYPPPHEAWLGPQRATESLLHRGGLAGIQ